MIGKKEIHCKLVLFDLDGTLLDERTRYHNLAQARFQTITNHAGPKAAKMWAKLSGINMATGTIDINGPLPKASRREDLSVATVAIYQTGRKWHEARTLAQEAYKDADRMQVTLYKPSLFHGTRETLIVLKGAGLMLGIATNGSGRASKELMDGLGMGGLFDVFVGADDVADAKPAPDMILLACERTGVEPSETVYVGNEPEDMMAARAASVGFAVAVYNLDNEMKEMADFSVCSITDIRAYSA